MKTALALLLAATLLPAQTKPKRTCPVEEIPKDAVQAQTKNGEAFCPRDDYKLEWFVQEGLDTDYFAGSSFEQSTNGMTIYHCPSCKKTYVFKPVCLPKEEK